jgi:hypothetical protein
LDKEVVMNLVRAVIRCAFVLLFLSCSANTFVTTKVQLRGTDTTGAALSLNTLEQRSDLDGGRCSDLVLRKQSVERWQNTGGEFSLGVIELSDDGHVTDDIQEQLVLEELDKVATAHNGAVIVTFVHGWHHRAKVCDNNLACFRRVLRALSESSGGRPVFGVYIGWRGDSWLKPSALSFWDRKNAAHHIGHDGGREVLLKLNDEYQRLNKKIDPKHHPVTMVTVGHSFGGALVYSAIEGALVREVKHSHVVGTPAESPNVPRPIRPGIGDLVVLVNPAFEASRYEYFANDLTTQGKSYSADQLPVLLTVASEGDSAVKVVFPIGRTLYFITHPWSFHGMSDVIGAGHYDPQTTHDLKLIDSSGHEAKNVKQPDKPKVVKATPEIKNHCELGPHDLMTCMCEYDVPENLTAVLRSDKPGLVSEGNGVVVIDNDERVSLQKRDPNFDSHAPFIVARASADIIPAHSDIYTPRFVEFLAGYIHEFLVQSIKHPPTPAATAQATTP